jgi:hypothetical protein
VLPITAGCQYMDIRSPDNYAVRRIGTEPVYTNYGVIYAHVTEWVEDYKARQERIIEQAQTL